VTALKWYPRPSTLTEIQVLTCVTSEGQILEWQLDMGDKCKTIMTNEANSYLCLDFNKSGEKLVVGGRLHQLEVYDTVTMAPAL
jgi:hypothetical protein